MFKISVKNCHLRSGYTVRPVWGWNFKEYEELLDCLRNLQHRVCTPVVGPQCSLEISFTICLCVSASINPYAWGLVTLQASYALPPRTRRIHRLGHRQSRTCWVQGAHRNGQALMVEYPTACVERNDIEECWQLILRKDNVNFTCQPDRENVRSGQQIPNDKTSPIYTNALLEVAFDSSAQISTIPNTEVHGMVHAIPNILSLVRYEDVMGLQAMWTHPTIDFQPLTDIQ
jgi:hypothetical protein